MNDDVIYIILKQDPKQFGNDSCQNLSNQYKWIYAGPGVSKILFKF